MEEGSIPFKDRLTLGEDDMTDDDVSINDDEDLDSELEEDSEIETDDEEMEALDRDEIPDELEDEVFEKPNEALDKTSVESTGPQEAVSITI